MPSKRFQPLLFFKFQLRLPTVHSCIRVVQDEKTTLDGCKIEDMDFLEQRIRDILNYFNLSSAIAMHSQHSHSLLEFNGTGIN